MSRKIKVWKDPYGEGFDICKKRSVTFESGLTVLVGCNGSGKTTMLHNIKEELKKEGIPVLSYDNLHDGGSHARSREAFRDNWAFVGTSMCSSEGENIVLNMSSLASDLGKFIRTGVDGRDSLARILDADKEVKSDERWILLDAIDSGLSVDNIVEVKEYLFKTILEHDFGKEIYIIVSANEYEMCRGERCFDVSKGSEVSIKSYDKYRKVILASRERKGARYQE